MRDQFDVITVGAGPAGLFCGFFLYENSNLKIAIIDKGKAPLQRKCPSTEKIYCLKCIPCDLLYGRRGAGLFSDGKLDFSYKLEKSDLTQFMDEYNAQKLIDEAEKIFDRFGMDSKQYHTNMDLAQNLRKKARKYGINLLITKQKHIGSDKLPIYINEMYMFLKDKEIKFITSTEVKNIILNHDDTSKRHIKGGKYEKFALPNIRKSPGRKF